MEKIYTVPLLPLRDIIVFPRMIIPLFIGRGMSKNAVDASIANNKTIFLAAQKNAKAYNPKKEEIFEIGTLAEILQILKLADGTVKILVEGTKRAKVCRFYEENQDFFKVDVIQIEKEVEMTQKVEALIRSITAQFEKYVKLSQRIPAEVINSVINITEPGNFCDTISTHLIIKTEEKQRILEMVDPITRMEEISKLLQEEIEIMQIEKNVWGRVKKQVEKSQKEYYLTEQMKAIQKELGKADDLKSEIDELKVKIKKAKMPKEANERALNELKKLEMMPPMSAEATVVRNYVDWFINLPWTKKSPDKINIDDAENILNQDHYGLDKVKERILEYLAVCKLVKQMKGPILCLVGPPGVGKTSLGKSIARATNRDFVRISLGGVRDEAEIRGHRRTYVGAMPGRIIQSLKKAKTKNPVFMLDEIDKMSTDFRGDPSSALLEVLDPEQNIAFNDHYLEVDFDLSEVMFITTANVLHTIPSPLLDRMEVLRIPGYTDQEKEKIAEKFLLPKKLKEHGLKSKNIVLLTNSLKNIIRSYTREAGVRNLDRILAKISRKIAIQVLKKGKSYSERLSTKILNKFLGMPDYKHQMAKEEHDIGIATGLAWTEVGGEILSTEVNIMDGNGKLTLTGKLGDVMQESAQTALSFVRSRARELGLAKNFYQKIDIHIHVPEGAIPKDGPSAGITMATAIISALTKSQVRKDVAMTGEITLRGKVLPIGGLKEKLLAAHRSDITTVLLPKENEKDLKDVPKIVKDALKIVLVESMDTVIEAALILDKNNTYSKKIKKTFIYKKPLTNINSSKTIH